ncbi:MAG TPA: multicopper oxidase domain-containing protein [Gaiellales bacterium]|nr:multicopper oxidase domain-containing protein [Gaiellales bacterium]
MHRLSRRKLLGGAAATGALPVMHGLIPHEGLHLTPEGASAATNAHGAAHEADGGRAAHGGFDFGADVDHRANGFHPSQMLRSFDWGRTRRLANGRVLREWEIAATDREIEVAPGVHYPAWTYNGRVPGPTLRCREGELVRIRFSNGSSHPHTIHFHGVHPALMDGMPGVGESRGGGLIAPGRSFTYEFDAAPFGIHHYHCHVSPLAAHIAKGLYGVFIIDPKQGRADADELLMVMNGFDTNFDQANEVYAVNTVGFHYARHPIRVKNGDLVRIYLHNILEFDPVNSFHIHANFFDYYPTGTRLEPIEYTDTVALAQGQRGILELQFPYPGMYMFHAHKTEFAELGWLGFFEVV